MYVLIFGEVKTYTIICVDRKNAANDTAAMKGAVVFWHVKELKCVLK